MNAKRDRLICKAALLAGVALAAGPVLAADVTPERLINADKEPQNWLMNHRTYDGQRFSPLARINKDNVKNLKLAYAVPLGGTRRQRDHRGDAARRGRLPLHHRFLGRRSTRSTARSGDVGRIVWRMDPKQEKQARQSRRRAVGQSRHLARQLAGAHHRHRQGDRQGRVGDQRVRRTGRACASPRRRSPIKDKIIVGASGGDRGVRDWIAGARCRDRQACCGANSPFRRPASPAARPGRTRTMPGRPAAAPCG